MAWPGIPDLPTTVSHPISAKIQPSRLRRNERRHSYVQVLNPGWPLPHSRVRGDFAARLVAQGLARFRAKGQAIWLISVSEQAPGVAAGTLHLATRRELRRIPVVMPDRLLRR